MNNSTVADVKITWNNKALKQIDERTQLGLFRMGYDIANRARERAPVLTSALRNSIRVQEDGNVVYIRAGGIVVGGRNINYALKREYENRAHPWTTHYMKGAQEDIMGKRDFMTTYFGGIA